MPPTLVLLAALAAQAPAVPPPTIELAAWLAGCWVREGADSRVDEQRMAPAAGVMLGMSRTVANSRVAEWEFIRIRQTSTGLAYIVNPSDQPEATFMLAFAGDGELRFENPDHDFPQRIIYRRQPDGSLLARIEGSSGGRARAVDFPFARTRCESLAAPHAPGDR